MLALLLQVFYCLSDTFFFDLLPDALYFAFWVGWLLCLVFMCSIIEYHHEHKTTVPRHRKTNRRKKSRRNMKYRSWKRKHLQELHEHYSNFVFGYVPDEQLTFSEQLLQEYNTLADQFDYLASRSSSLDHFYGSSKFFTFFGPCDSSYYCAADIEELPIHPEQRGFIYYNDALRDIPLIFDSGATVSVTPNKSDFYSFETVNETINGITESGSVVGKGMIQLEIYDDQGKKHKIQTFALYVPKAKVRLLSVSAYCGVNTHCAFQIKGKNAIFSFGGGDISTFTTYNSTTGRASLPLAFITQSQQQHTYPVMHNVMTDSNINLTSAQRELIGWHFKLAHFHILWIQNLTRPMNGTDPCISCRLTGASSCPLPQCTACNMAKAHYKSDGSLNVEVNTKKDGGLKDSHLTPGAKVSTDQFVCSQKGRLHTGTGTGRDHLKYTGGTILVDHASGLIFVNNQVSLNADETIRGKHKFERYARTFGVEIKEYRGDNGIFRSKAYKEDLEKCHQTIDYSGVGAHHQNGVAERAIRTVSEAARAMLIHASLHWPEQTTPDLWPFALEYAAYIWNHLPKRNGGPSPIEIFTGTKQNTDWIRRSRVWGCPAYVLDPTIQDGKKLPRRS